MKLEVHYKLLKLNKLVPFVFSPPIFSWLLQLSFQVLSFSFFFSTYLRHFHSWPLIVKRNKQEQRGRTWDATVLYIFPIIITLQL